MNARCTLILAALAGLPATLRAQEVMRVNYDWLEVITNTTNPVASPNSIVEPGEGARIRLRAEALFNGASAIGQTTSYTNPAPGGVGTVRSLGAVVWDLIGDGNASSAFGTWYHILGASPPLSGDPGPTVQPGGASVWGLGGAQFVLPGQTASGSNNVQMFRGVWTPAANLAFTERTVTFLARSSVLVPTGQGNGLLLAYGYSTALTPQGDPYTYDLLAGKYISIGAGQGLAIPIAPAPSALAAFGLATAIATNRRRPRAPSLSTSAPSAHPQTPAPGPSPSETPARSAP